MVKNPRTAASHDARIELIANESVRLIVRQGYQTTSVREIAKACGMSPGHLYYYVGPKENILRFLAQRDASKVNELLQQSKGGNDPIASLEVAVKTWYRYCDQWQDWMIIVNREFPYLPQEIQKQLLAHDRSVRDGFEALLAGAVRDGRMHVNDIPLVASNLQVCGLTWALRRWDLRKRYTIEQYIEAQLDLVKHLCTAH